MRALVSALSSPLLLSRRASRSLVARAPPRRCLDSSRLEVRPVSPERRREKPRDPRRLVFGRTMTDHMLTCEWRRSGGGGGASSSSSSGSARCPGGWGRPLISGLRPLSLHPAAKVLHYAEGLFEGMKASRGADGRIRLFRPMHNMVRMGLTARRACLPDFPPAELLECVRQLVRLEREWVPRGEAASLYVRPALIGTEPSLGLAASSEALLYVICGPVGPFFSDEGQIRPIKLMADPRGDTFFI